MCSFSHQLLRSELRACGAPVGEVARVLRRHKLEALAARSPWGLSRVRAAALGTCGTRRLAAKGAHH